MKILFYRTGAGGGDEIIFSRHVLHVRARAVVAAANPRPFVSESKTSFYRRARTVLNSRIVWRKKKKKTLD